MRLVDEYFQKTKSYENRGGYSFDSPTKKSQPSVVELLLDAAFLPAQLRPREARAKQQALLLTMNAAALLRVKAELGKLRQKGALTTDQFQLLKTRAKHGVVTDEVLGLLGQAWALRCDGTSDEQEYTEDISNVISEIPPVSLVCSCTGLASTIGATTGSSCGCSIKSRSEEKQRDGEGRQEIPEHLERLHPRPGRQTGECMLYVVQSSTVVQ